MNSFEFETRNDISSVFYISKNMSQFKKVLIGDLGAIALEIRREILTMVNRANSGHVGGSLSAVEILVALYHNLMKHDPSNPKWVERDRFIMGKGHATPVYYAVLASCGYISQEDLLGFRRPGSYLQGHPKQKTEKGIEVSTGTLGLGLSTACGMALAGKIRNECQKYYCLCGDGEIQEGQIWEAAMFANKYKLNNLIAFVDRNYMQSDGYSEEVMPLDPLPPKWEGFGWEVYNVDGHDFENIINTVEKAKLSDKPVMIIARTIKGKGVSFMENDNKWHGTPPNDDITDKALAELAP
jgi:transketolase